jgi:uncharacterized metal-binding protein
LFIVLRWGWNALWIGGESDLLQEAQYIYNAGFGLYSSIDPSYLLASFIGLWIGAEAHTVADMIWSATKKKRS